ncbi:MAG: dihydropteroate synthase, partial [Actinobacteria bacterium]|nr:dihydropteroate synthase [Actinomycetota bacterium]
MGVLNVTPDSFSDGGQFLEFDSALAHAREMAEQGAQIIDIGGESTRPGSMRVSLDQEQQRVLPVIRAIKDELKVKVSIDTMNADTAAKAIAEGADIVNDVSGGLADPQIFAAVSDSDCNYVLGHWRGHSDIMDSLTTYSDVAREVVAELAEQVSMAVAAGIARERIVVDPGLGFAKDMKQNWDLVARLDELENLELPILVGASRKRFIAHALDSKNPQSV